jgi:tricorn protease
MQNKMTHRTCRVGSGVALTLLATAFSTISTAQTGYYRQPAIHGDTIVFVAEGDLWRTSIQGGAAQRLTTNLAEETFPRISPDGKLVAFTARYEGPAEVYVMPITGGLPTRLTHEGDNARVQGFTDDGRVLYSTARWSGKPSQRMYVIDPATKKMSPVPLAEAAEGCYLDKTLYFTREPLGSDNVKNYRGGLVQRVWQFNGTTEAAPLTNNDGGMSRQPMCDAKSGRVFFLSDRDGTMNLWSVARDGGNAKQHTQHKGLDIRSANIARDAASVVYQRGADVVVHDVASGRDRVLNITLQSDFEHTRTRWVKNPFDFVTNIEPSPNGDRVAITARGEIFVMPVGNGRRVELLRDANVRARNAVFSADGKSVFAFGDASGEFELMRYAANGVGAPTTLTKDAKTLRRSAYPSPDGKWIVHNDLERKLYLTELSSGGTVGAAAGTTTVIDRAEEGLYETVTWSPDSRYLAFHKAASNGFERLFIYDVQERKLQPITSDRYDARDAAFSPDGKWLYFLGGRNLQSTVPGPWGQRNPMPNFDRQQRIYAYALDATARWPYLVRDELQPPPAPATPTSPASAPAKKADDKTDAKTDASKGADAKADTKADPKPTPKSNPIAWDGLSERLYEVPVPPGNYRQLTTDGKRLFFLQADAVERKTSLRSVAIEAPNPTPPTVDVFFDDVRQYALTRDAKKLFIRRQNDLFVFDAGKSAPPPPEQGKFAVNARDWMIQIDPRREWQQMFNDVWRMHRDYFYDKNLQGADWATARARYQPLLDRATDRAEVSDVIAQMVSEVRALHSQVGPGDIRRSQDTIDVAALGADTVKVENGFRVSAVFGGDPELLEERSPLARPEVNVRVGDVITAVNGVPAASATTLGELLRNQADKQVLLSVSNSAGAARNVVVVPVNPQRDRELRYLAWERERKIAVERASESRIGYVHLQAMGPNDIARWAREFYPVFQREGLIIDLRDNNGGNIDSWIISTLQRRAWHFWQSRQSDTPFGNQQFAFRGHVVALIDGGTYSDGETMAQGLRRLGIAPLVGMTTAGAGIWLSDQNRLRDNGIARAAQFGTYVDTKSERAWMTEFVGVKPDVEVDNLPVATYKGGDAQLDRAIQMLMEKMRKEPLTTPQQPDFPNLNRAR